MTPLYQSRQVSWFLIGMAVVLTAVILALTTRSGESELPLWFYPIYLVIFLPFSVMDVTVTREHVRVAFLLRVPRKTVPIGDIKTCEPYRAQGMQRLVVQVKPIQGDFKLTGGGGIVLTRHRGTPITISDPQPEKLARAVARARGHQDKSGRT